MIQAYSNPEIFLLLHVHFFDRFALNRLKMQYRVEQEMFPERGDYFHEPNDQGRSARFLRVSLWKLDQLAADGEIPYSKFGVGRRARVVYRQEDLERYVERNLVQIHARAARLHQR